MYRQVGYVPAREKSYDDRSCGLVIIVRGLND